jgi:hypothetical protein
VQGMRIQLTAGAKSKFTISQIIFEVLFSKMFLLVRFKAIKQKENTRKLSFGIPNVYHVERTDTT